METQILRKKTTDAWGLSSKKSLIIVSVLIVANLLVCSSEVFAQDGPKVLKVKGLYLGMSIEEVSQRFPYIGEVSQRFGEKEQVQKGDSSNFYYTIGDGINYDIRADSNKKVTSIFFSGPMVDIMFNTHEMDGEEFVQAFVDAYHIPEMKPNVWGTVWEFTSRSHAYKVAIDFQKTIRIWAIPKQSELKFD